MNERSGGPTREDWVVAGLRALAESGIDAVKVERLAKTLGISKGPFYWRFADRAELLAAMLEFWKDEFTARLIEEIEPFKAPRARLQRLVELALATRLGNVDVAQAEGALRAWAAQDPMAREAAREVDALRTRYLADELMLMGAGEAKAMHLARGIYLALLGLYTARRYTPEEADDEAYRIMVRMALDAAEASPGPG